MGNRAYKLVLKNILRAYKGRKIWLQLIKEYGLGEKDYVILMPSTDRDYNYYSLLYLDKFLKRVSSNRAIILTFDENVIKSAYLFSENIEIKKGFTREQAELLMKCYCMYMFTDKLIICSLEEPEGRNGKQLVGKKNMSLEEVIAICIYGFKKFEKQECPIYVGNDEGIKKFLQN